MICYAGNCGSCIWSAVFAFPILVKFSCISADIKICKFITCIAVHLNTCKRLQPKGGFFMARIIDYSYLLQQTFGIAGVSGGNLLGSFRLSEIGSSSVQAQLKAAGIDTSSNQYKAAMREMQKNGNGAMFTNVQAIKNSMRCYDKDGDYIDPTTGLAGLLVTDANESSRKRIISIPESSRDEMFEQTKKEFLRENGVLNGDTTKRSDVYTNMYRKVTKNDRLAAGYTMEQYERAYRQAFLEAARKADPSWEIGRPVRHGALDGITRESVEAGLRQSGNTLKRVSVDTRV